MNHLYPRLALPEAQKLYADYRSEFESKDVEGMRLKSQLAHPEQAYAATGGTRVPEERMRELRRRVRDLAERCGWPRTLSEAGKARFDAEGPRILVETMDIVPADAGSSDVWMFISLVLLPEIPPWRWPTWNERRFLDHPRNTFRNLFWRGYVLGTERSGPLEVLGEDEIVSVMERSSLSGNPDVARTIYSVYLPIRDELGDISPMFLMRDYAKRLRRLTSFECLDVLDPEQLQSVCAGALGKALDAAGSSASVEVRQEAASSVEGSRSEDHVAGPVAGNATDPGTPVEHAIPEASAGEVQPDRVTAIGQADDDAEARSPSQEEWPLCSGCDLANEARLHAEAPVAGLECAKCHAGLESRCRLCGRLVTAAGCRTALEIRNDQPFKFASQRWVARAETLHFTEEEITELITKGQKRTMGGEDGGTTIEVFSGPNGHIQQASNTRLIVELHRSPAT